LLTLRLDKGKRVRDNLAIIHSLERLNNNNVILLNKEMRVSFKFYGNLVNYFGEEASVDVEEGVTIQEALMKLKLLDGTPAYASVFINTHLQMLIVFVSGKHASLNTRLKGESVEVVVLPPIIGG
jgi:hypothetical protein